MNLLKPKKPAAQEGFALLITLVVVSVVLAIGLSLLFVTTKQYVLAVTANESERAFEAAQIGLECMRYWRAQPTTREQLLSQGSQRPPLTCAGVSSAVQNTQVVLQQPSAGAGPWMYGFQYSYNFTDMNSCVQTSLYVADLRDSTTDFAYRPAGESLDTLNCKAGTLCTAILARGYNRPCQGNQPNSAIYTLQREITTEY